MGMTRVSALAAIAILTIGCGSGDDDTTNGDAAGAPEATDPAEADDTQPGSDESIADEPSAAESGAVAENISGGRGTLTIDLPDGRTEMRDVDCAIYTDQFEVTFEYSDILDDDQSVNFYYREEGTDISDVNFTFHDPQLGGLIAKNVATASNTSMSGATLSVDLNVLIVGSADAAGNPETADVSLTGTCAAS